jgi:macrolide transport system ATP-binding/permease protein
MRWFDIRRLRLRSIFRRARVEEELDEELRYHLERELEQGAPQAGAGITQRKEECRDMRGLNLIDNSARDLRFAIRQLHKNAGFTSTAILMLALGMCASVTIFALVDAALIKPLPYRDPQRLVAVYETTTTCPRCNVSYLNFRGWKKNQTVFRALDVWGFTTFLLRTPDGTRVSDGFFRTLGITPALGRDFYTGEDAPGSPRTVILSFAAWQHRFGGDRGVLGQSITLSDVPYTIVGVLPREFQFAARGSAEFWVPLNDTIS